MIKPAKGCWMSYFFREKVFPFYFNETKHRVQRQGSGSELLVLERNTRFSAQTLVITEEVLRTQGIRSPVEASATAGVVVGAQVEVWSQVVGVDLPVDVAKLDAITSGKLDLCESSKVSGWFSLTFRAIRIWSSASKSPSENRIRQFCNMLTILLTSGFSPSQILPWKQISFRVFHEHHIRAAEQEFRTLCLLLLTHQRATDSKL